MHAYTRLVEDSMILTQLLYWEGVPCTRGKTWSGQNDTIPTPELVRVPCRAIPPNSSGQHNI